jgi:hypothetical protein
MAELRCHFFYTPEVASSFPTSSKRQVDKGTAFLKIKGYGMRIRSYPLNAPGTPIPGLGGLINPEINNGGLSQYLKLRNQCHAAMPDADPPRVPVIFLKFSTADDAGQTVQMSSQHPWPPFILIDAEQANTDGLTLLHEMGHCVGLRHPGEPPSVPGVKYLEAHMADNFMGYGQPKTDNNGYIKGQFHERGLCDDFQIKQLRLAYFYSA